MIPYSNLQGYLLTFVPLLMITAIFSMMLYFFMKKGFGNKISGKIFRILWFLLFTAYTCLLLSGKDVFSDPLLVKAVRLPYLLPLTASIATIVLAVFGALKIGLKDRKYNDPTVSSALESIKYAYILEDETNEIYKNSLMKNLSSKITGKKNSNIESIWENIQSADESNGIINKGQDSKPILVFPDHTVWTFLKGSFKIGERKYYELMGQNITEEYRLAEQIEQGKENLKRQKRRVEALEKGNESIILKRTEEGVKLRMSLLFTELNKTINATRLHLSGLSKSDNSTINKRWAKFSGGLR